MEFELPEEQSKFQLYSGKVLKFLLDEQKKPDEVKLIYPHQIEAVLAVKKYFSVTQPDDNPALVGNNDRNNLVLVSMSVIFVLTFSGSNWSRKKRDCSSTAICLGSK